MIFSFRVCNEDLKNIFLKLHKLQLLCGSLNQMLVFKDKIYMPDIREKHRILKDWFNNLLIHTTTQTKNKS